MLLGWDLTYRSWRWWHAPTRHAKAIAVSMASSLYLQCAEGTVDPEWKVTPVSGPRFWQRMSLQMVQYICSNLQYPGDEKMRNTTQMNKKKRGTSDIGLIKCDNHIKRVSYSQYLDEKNPRGEKRPGSALEIWRYWSNIRTAWRGCIWQLVKCVAKKHTWSVRYARSMFVSRVERICLVCPVALISMMILCMV